MYGISYIPKLLEVDYGDKARLAWDIAKACVGWSYVFGGRGQTCTPSNRRAMNYAKYPTIKSACKNFDGSGSCAGCKWYPNSERTRFFDCRGFTYWVLLQVYGWKLMGAGATSQWNTVSNWTQKGLVSEGIPKDTLVCLFYQDKQKPTVMAHTGFGLNGETIECSSGVVYSSTMNKKWTHWAVPACVSAIDTDVKPVVRRGDKGQSVILLQTQLELHGYDLGPCGIDGDFGKATQAAVEKFQKDHGLTVDGIVGPKTWEMLEAPPDQSLYTVHIPSLTKTQAQALADAYAGAWISDQNLEG